VSRSKDPIAVARATGGIHAQVQASAELQLAARVDGVVQADIRRALWEERSLVKAWTLRGTLHIHPADELALWFAARSAVSAEAKELPEWPDPSGVVHPPVRADEVADLRAAVWDAFDGRALLRDELATAVVDRVGPKHEGRLRSGFAFFTSELCQGPPQGNKITLARPDQWLSSWQEVDEREALREVVRRFLHAYGPARAQDFREWFRADAPFEDIDLDEVEVEGRRAFVLAGDAEFPTESDVVRLLPEYDVYVMGFREREHLVPEPVRAQVAAHSRGRYEGPAGVRFLLIDGVAAGMWERKKRGKRIELTVAPVRKLKRAERAGLEAEAQRIGAFLGHEPALTVE
jgi:Winged helix DNA-binding domain